MLQQALTAIIVPYDSSYFIRRDINIILIKIRFVVTVMIKQQQFQHESSTWERLLDFFKQENTFLKNRLSEVLDSKDDKSFVSTAEHFQNMFLLKDDYINELKKDIKEQQRQLKMNFSQDGNDVEVKLIKKQEKLRNEIKNFERNFSELKDEFNQSLIAL